MSIFEDDDELDLDDADGGDLELDLDELDDEPLNLDDE
jgi:hypothetical protein